ncbi:MAG: phage tail tape measure protein [Phycisphaeraceae bacterium]
MARSRSIRAGRAYVELGVEDRLTRGLRRAEQRLKQFGSQVRQIGTRVAGLGAAIVTPLLAASRLFASAGDDLNKMAARTGVSVEALSELGFAAQQSGTDLASVGKVIQRMNRRLGRAADGSGEAATALKRMGLSIEQLLALNPEQRFMAIIDAMHGMENAAEAAGLGQRIFGAEVDRILPLIGQGAAGIDALRRQARQLGLTISTEAAAEAAKFTDAMNVLRQTLRRAVFTIGGALAPTLTDLAERFATLVASANDWIRRHQRLIVIAAAVGAALVGVGTALIGLGLGITLAGAALGTLATLITGAVKVVTLLGAALAVMASTTGLAVVAVAALGAAILHASGAGGRALAWLGERFGELYERAQRTFQGIADAMAAGDIALAGRVLWLALQAEWQRGVNALTQIWLRFRHAFLNVMNTAFHGALAAFQFVAHGLEVAWIETVAFLQRAWQRFNAFFQGTWRRSVAWVAERFLELQGVWDETFDVEDAKQILRADVSADLQQITRDRDAALRDIDQRRDRRREQAAEHHEATLGVIGQQYEDAKDRLASAYDEQRRRSEEALARARREWEQALQEAAQRRAAIEAGEGGAPDGLQTPGDFLGNLDDLIGQMRDAAERTVDVRGTFSPLLLERLGAGRDTAERTAKATEDTARNTKRLSQQAQQGGLAFS